MIVEFNDAQILFGMFQGFKKATPYGGARKLRLTLPPVCHDSLLRNSFNSYALKRGIYFTDSKLDGLDDALIQQTQMESFLPISGCVDMKSGIWVATWFAGLLLLF